MFACFIIGQTTYIGNLVLRRTLVTSFSFLLFPCMLSRCAFINTCKMLTSECSKLKLYLTSAIPVSGQAISRRLSQTVFVFLTMIRRCFYMLIPLYCRIKRPHIRISFNITWKLTRFCLMSCPWLALLLLVSFSSLIITSSLIIINHRLCGRSSPSSSTPIACKGTSMRHLPQWLF